MKVGFSFTGFINIEMQIKVKIHELYNESVK